MLSFARGICLTRHLCNGRNPADPTVSSDGSSKGSSVKCRYRLTPTDGSLKLAQNVLVLFIAVNTYFTKELWKMQEEKTKIFRNAHNCQSLLKKLTISVILIQIHLRLGRWIDCILSGEFVGEYLPWYKNKTGDMNSLSLCWIRSCFLLLFTVRPRFGALSS